MNLTSGIDPTRAGAAGHAIAGGCFAIRCLEQTKTVFEIAPVLLKNEGRIEALFFIKGTGASGLSLF
jgi:hypothetical protein